MEFGFFEDLSEPDQAYVREILSCSGNSTKGACKGLKKPEFSWITDSEGLTRLAPKEHDPNELGDASQCHTEVIPPHPVGVPVLSNMGFSPQMGVPVGFQMGQFISTYPPGMLPGPPGMVPVFMQAHPLFGVPSGVPIALPVEQMVTANMNAQSDMSSEVPISKDSPETDQLKHNQDPETDISSQMKVEQKIYERRNKKRRPPDYYEKLAAKDKTPSENVESNSAVKDSAIDHSKTIDINNELYKRTSDKTNVVEYCSVPQQATVPSECANTTITSSVHSTSYAQTQSNKSISHVMHQTTSPMTEIDEKVTSASQSAAQILCDNTPENYVKASEHFTQHIAEPSVLTNETKTLKGEVNKVTNIPNQRPVSPITFMGSEDETIRLKQDPQSSKVLEATSIDTNNCNNSESAEIKPPNNNIKDLSERNVLVETKDNESTQEKQNLTNVSNTEHKDNMDQSIPAKKSSWAGLFSGTLQAKNATVIYTANNSSKQQELDQKESKSEEKAPTVVEPNEDKMVQLIGDVLLKHRLNHKVISLQPRGLKNRRNWCYVSATLQALLACPPFYHLMKALPYGPAKSRGPSSTPVIDCLCDFVHQFTYLPPRAIADAQKALNGKGTMRMDIPQGSTFEPTNVYDVLKTPKYASAFLYGRQEDAEEFLSCFLNGLHDEMVECMKSTKDENAPDVTCNGTTKHSEDCSVEEEKSTNNPEEDEGWEQVGPKNKAVVTRTTDSPSSPISALFQGQIRSILHQTGARESATLQPFFTLQLDIQSDKVWTLKDALDGLVRKECLHDYTCSKTKQEVEATRRITLEELPPVLILHLKYFLYDKNGGCQKLSKQVDFGIDLEISKDLLSPNVKSKVSPNQRKYKLFGVVNHHGSRAIGGHYTAYVFHVGINGWIHIDDEIIRTVNVAQVLKHNPPKVPYLLYYRKVDVQ